jgi:hypothetical protein
MIHRRRQAFAMLGRNVMFRPLIFSTVTAAALAASAPALAQAVQVGVLECAGGQSVGYVIGSSTALNCVFRPSTGRGGGGYIATVNRVGLDVGVTTTSGVSWLVFAPSRNLARGALAGHYAGVSANAAVGVGGGANVLAGGSNNTITLQPVSVQGQTGINLAATVTGLDLSPAAAPRTIRTKRVKKKTS